jgi:ribosomal protein L37E
MEIQDNQNPPILNRIFKQLRDGKTRSWHIKNDLCPECGGELDTGWECNDCGFDAMPEVEQMRNDQR